MTDTDPTTIETETSSALTHVDVIVQTGHLRHHPNPDKPLVMGAIVRVPMGRDLMEHVPEAIERANEITEVGMDQPAEVCMAIAPADSKAVFDGFLGEGGQ